MASTTTVPEAHHVQIRADAGRPPVDLVELHRSRELLLAMVDRDIKVRYKQTVLGVVWVILQPLMASLIFAFLFGVLARMESDGVPYLLFAFAGLTAWNTFGQVLTRSSNSLVSNGHMLAKVYFPRLILPVAAAGSALVDTAVSLVMMLALLAIYRHWPGPGLLLLPAWLALVVLMALGLGLVAAALMVKYRDVGHVIPTFLQLGLFVSPVAWSTLVVPEQYRWVVLLNPLSGLLEAFRWSLLGVGSLQAGPLAYSAAASLAIFWFGAVEFKRHERDFADVI